MKEYLKKFFKSKINIAILVSAVLGIVFALLGIIGNTFLMVGVIFFVIASVMLCYQFYNRYQDNKDYEPEVEGRFDATTIDFDEDVYQMPTKKNVFKKRRLSKMDLLAPVVLFGICAAAFIIYLIILIVMMFI